MTGSGRRPRATSVAQKSPSYPYRARWILLLPSARLHQPAIRSFLGIALALKALASKVPKISSQNR